MTSSGARILAAAVLCLSMACGTGDKQTLATTDKPPVLFADLAAAVGLNFHHDNGRSGSFYFPEPVGAGAALLDFDNDGDLDIYLIQGGPLESSSAATGNRLFENRLVPDGVMQFEDVTEGSGLGDPGYGMGVATGDVDNDGHVDIYVSNFGANKLFLNRGNGAFEDATENCNCDDPRWSTSAAFTDYDRDGDLDLYVANYVKFSLALNKQCFGVGGRRDYCGPQVFEPEPDSLFENLGEGKFRDISEQSGIAKHAGPGLGVLATDLDGDLWPDIYVANDQNANFLFTNQKGGKFTETAMMSGSAVNAFGMPEASMGITAGDFDNDGDDDLFMTHLASQTNTLFVNDGRGGFTDSTQRFGLGVPSAPMTGFGARWFDIDNDGLLDLFSANGGVMLVESQIGKSDYPYEQLNQLFRQQANGSFTDISTSAGDAFGLLEVSRGAAFGDIDNDGNTDILVTNNNGPVRLLVNQATDQKNWVSLRLVGTSSNRSAYGARIGLTSQGKTFWKRVGTDGSYLSASDNRVHFGLGSRNTVEAVEVFWPGGTLESWNTIEVGKFTTLTEAGGQQTPR